MREDLNKFRQLRTNTLVRGLERDLCDASLDSVIDALNNLKESYGGNAKLDIFEDDGMIIINLERHRQETDEEVLFRMYRERGALVTSIAAAEFNLSRNKEKLAEYDSKLARS